MTALTVRQLIDNDQFRAQIARALPAHLTPDRFLRVALTTVLRTPKLAQCDQASIANALLTCSQLGLEPDGRRAHLIPYEDRKRGAVTCQLIIDYKGLVELALRSGEVAMIHADVVCEHDVFEYDRGEVTKHVINFKEPRGKPYAAYAMAKFKNGATKYEVMTKDEIEAIRARSRAGQSGPWVTDWSEMAKKTVFRRLAKWLPLSPEYRDALDADDDRLVDDTPPPRPIKQAEIISADVLLNAEESTTASGDTQANGKKKEKGREADKETEKEKEYQDELL
ncbi:MAG: recombinase RecT [Candidatus Methanomethylicaceae archaeon]